MVEVAQLVRAGGLRCGSYEGRAGFRACRTAIIEISRQARATRALDPPINIAPLHQLAIYRLLRCKSWHYRPSSSRKPSAAELSRTSSAEERSVQGGLSLDDLAFREDVGHQSQYLGAS